ncbi:MAG: patatin-like phospholipase family protein [Bacteroidales bacterium]|nr:patatin-like phospholipase family protein [Bacteroidales bacterium]
MPSPFFKYFFLFILLIGPLSGISSSQPDDRPPRVGLTLSGGGAKGLAHVGVLHIIDSLGIKIDYVTGTSMGSIVGGMYAAGYTASELEEIALTLDWPSLFSSRSNLTYTHPGKREDFGRYIVELPIENRSIKFPSGAIEGQQMWNVLSDIFFNVRNINDFNNFPIPFACVATDVITGDTVILNSGDIVAALRASMAIPSVFTTIEIDNRQLVDGGVVMNFPVVVVKDMGADFVIGVNVSRRAREDHNLKTPLEIMYQMGTYLDARNFEKNRKLTDIYLEPDLDEFTAASFNNVQEIIERGKQIARKNIDQFLELKEMSVDRRPAAQFTPIPEDQKIVVDSIWFKGLHNIRPWFVRNALDISKGDTISSLKLNSRINRLYASGYFNRIIYNLLPSEDESKSIVIFDFDENPFGSLGVAIHYSSFTGVGIIGNLATNKLFFYNVGGYLKAQLGEKPAIKGGVNFFTSDRQNNWFNIESLARYLVFPVYDEFEIIGEYRQRYFRAETSWNRLTGQNSYFSLGLGYYYQGLNPNIRTDFSVRGNNHSNEVFAGWRLNSLDRQAFPRSGVKLNIHSTYFFNQKPSYSYTNPQGDVTSDLSEVGIKMENYLQFSFNWESWLRVSQRLSSFNQLQMGYNYQYQQSFINNFNMGGTYPFLKNQIVFAGLNEYEILTKSAVVGTMGWQYNVWDEFMITPTVNAALYDFDLGSLNDLSGDNFILGTGLKIGYFSAVGPLEVTFSYSPQTRKILAYINLGWTF